MIMQNAYQVCQRLFAQRPEAITATADYAQLYAGTAQGEQFKVRFFKQADRYDVFYAAVGHRTYGLAFKTPSNKPLSPKPVSTLSRARVYPRPDGQFFGYVAGQGYRLLATAHCQPQGGGDVHCFTFYRQQGTHPPRGFEPKAFYGDPTFWWQAIQQRQLVAVQQSMQKLKHPIYQVPVLQYSASLMVIMGGWDNRAPSPVIYVSQSPTQSLLPKFTAEDIAQLVRSNKLRDLRQSWRT